MADGTKGRGYAGQVLDAAFLGTPLPWQDAAAFEISLHTAEPQGDSGELLAEASYPGYARLIVPRDGDNWQRDGEAVRNLRDLRWPTADEAMAGDQRVTHWAIRPAGDTTIVWRGELPSPIVLRAMVRPVLDAGAVEVSEI